MSAQWVQVIGGQTADNLAAAIHGEASAKALYHQDLLVALDDNLRQSPAAIGGPYHKKTAKKHAVLREFPDLEKLFGSQSFCECEHCRSVYSPAAYLVDLLHVFLDHPSKQPGQIDIPMSTLRKRRPDLANTKLSCENTNTPLPYIDLVNEVLESYIKAHLAGNAWGDSAQGDAIKAYDTGSTPADELRAVPQNLEPAVYSYLASEAVYPMTLPFDRSLEVVRAYLAHLGTSRAEVMEVFRAPTAADPAKILPLEHDIAIERLGLSPKLAKIIDGTDGKPFWEYYGCVSSNEALSLLKQVTELLKRTGLDLNDLLGLLKTQFIPGIQIAYPAFPEDACDVGKMKIVNLDAGNLGRIHRFVRLWRVLGWTMADLDRALTALGGELVPDTLDKLAALRQLALDLDCPVAELLVLWAKFDTWGEDSTYHQVFQSPALVCDADAKAAFTKIHDGGSVALDTKFASAVAAALAVTSDDLQRIRSHLEPAGQAPSTLDLALLSALCRYGQLAKALGVRVRDLITLLSLAPPDADPFNGHDPRPAVTFVRMARAVLNSGFSIPLLNYLFRGAAEPTRHPAPTRALIETTLKDLQKGLAAIYQETVVPDQPTAEDLRAALDLAKNLLGDKDAAGKLVTPLSPDEALAILDPRVSKFDNQPIVLGGRTKFVDDHFTVFLSSALKDGLFDSTFASDPSEGRFLQNVSVVLGALLPWLRAREQELLVTQTTAGAVAADETLANALLKGKVADKYLLHSAGDDQRPALEDFLSLIDPAGVAIAFDADDATAAPVASFVRLFRAAAYVNGFGMTEPELRLFASPSTPAKIPGAAPAKLDLNVFPLDLVAAADPQPGQSFELWQQLAKYYELRATLPKSEKTLPDFLPQPNDPTTIPDVDTLVEATGWENTLLNALLTGFKTKVTDLVDLDRLSGLHRAVQLTKRLGASLKLKEGNPSQLEQPNVFDWAATPPDGQQADAIVQMVKARYERAQWLEVARGLNDPMREKQRDAMLALLLVRLAPVIPVAQFPHPLLTPGAKGPAVVELQKKLNASQAGTALAVDGVFGPKTLAAVKQFQKAYGLAQDGQVGPLTWDALDEATAVHWTPNELLEYLLIDVEMNSCMLTSRIKQAVSSVQLFIHRCLLNLEPDVSPLEIDLDWWGWSKNYRVWEANRKVFLYPENWAESELRDDKTPFFKDLETELLQNEITDTTVEKALVNYLYKLDEVARLDIRGFCRELIPENPKDGEKQKEIYHVFGRTWNPPYVYYYRKGTFDLESDSDGEWTAWERADLDIDSDHIVPVLKNGRLYVFWPVLQEKAGQTQTEDTAPPTYWAIKLAWSEREAGGWSRRATTRDVMVTEDLASQVAASDYWIVATVEENRLDLDFYLPALSEKLGGLSSSGLDLGKFGPSIPGIDVEIYAPGVYQFDHRATFSRYDCHANVLPHVDDKGSVDPLTPVPSWVDSQRFVGDKGLTVEETLILGQTHAGYAVAVAPKFTLTFPYSFFFQDGTRGSNTYFARSVSSLVLNTLRKSGGAIETPPIQKQKTSPVAELVGDVLLVQKTGGLGGSHA